MSSYELLGKGPYLAGCLCVLLLGIAVAVRHRRSLSLFSDGYRRFLATPWRVATFVLGTFALAVIAPYTGDPTWDYGLAVVMATLTFATGPWSLGCLYRAARGREGAAVIFVAVVCWLTAASWSYDLYVLLRQHVYPPSAAANLFASSVLFVTAGLFWNLDWRPGRGVTFAFLESDWPTGGKGGAFGHLAGYALAFAAVVTLTLGWVFLRP
jgi:hypothetical protein